MAPMKRIIVTSAKGGIGKSTVAVGLAAALSRMGKRILLVDCDVGNRCVDLMLGLENEVLYDVDDVAAGRCAPEDALLSHPELVNLRIVAAPLVGDAPHDRIGALTKLAEAAEADVVLLDTAGTGEFVRQIAGGFADGALVIATQQPTSLRAAERTALLMDELGALPCRLIISMFEEYAARDGIRAGLLEIIDKTHLRTVGVVPKDRSLLIAQESGSLPAEKSRAGRAFSNIAARLTGDEIPLFSGIKEIKTAKVL